MDAAIKIYVALYFAGYSKQEIARIMQDAGISNFFVSAAIDFALNNSFDKLGNVSDGNG